MKKYLTPIYDTDHGFVFYIIGGSEVKEYKDRYAPEFLNQYFNFFVSRDLIVPDSIYCLSQEKKFYVSKDDIDSISVLSDKLIKKIYEVFLKENKN